jgi:hypothetical protein
MLVRLKCSIGFPVSFFVLAHCDEELLHVIFFSGFEIIAY